MVAQISTLDESYDTNNKHFESSCELRGLIVWIWFETDFKLISNWFDTMNESTALIYSQHIKLKISCKLAGNINELLINLVSVFHHSINTAL